MDENNRSELAPAVDVPDNLEARLKFWIATFSRPRSGNNADAQLAKNPHCPIGTYVATQSQIREWNDRKKEVEFVVIPMAIPEDVSYEEEILEIKKLHLIRKVLTFPGRKGPAHIPSKQIKQLKLMLNESDAPIEFEQTVFKQLDKVRVIRGNLTRLEREVIRTNSGLLNSWCQSTFMAEQK